MTINKQNRFVSVVLVVAMLMGLMSVTAVAEPDPSFKPLTNITIGGNFGDLYVPGVTFTLSYDGASSIDGELSEIVWYAGDSQNGEFEAITDATEESFKVPSAVGGKYLKAGIMPVSADGSTTGNEVYSDAVYIEPALARPVQIYNTAMDDIGWSAYAANVINADEFELGNSKSKFFVLDVSEDGSEFLVMDDYIDKDNNGQSFACVGLSSARTLNMDPSDENNKLAYWLNTTYLNSTAYDTLTKDDTDTVCSSYIGLPKAIVDNINRDAVWRTEMSTENGVIDEYVFKAAITLPSYTEIKTYGSKIKRVPNRQLLTRTVHNAAQMYAIGDHGANGKKHLIGIPLTTAGVIRPIFKLKRSFFTTTRIEPSKMGTNVKTIIATNFARSEVEHLYTDEEMTAMGFPVAGSEYDADYKPLNNLELNGNYDDLYAPGVTLTFSYDGASSIDTALSSVAWYVSDSKNSGFEEIADETANTFKLTANHGGKYIKAGITPVSPDGSITGPEVYSQVVYVEPALKKPVQIYNTAMTDIGWSAYAANVINDDEFEFGNSKSKFFVLDAEEDGSEFLVMDDYIDKDNGGQSFACVGLSSARTLNMDPSDPNNKLAYWLNTTYLNSTAYDTLTKDDTDTVCSSYIGLPKAIIDNINRNAVWRTEASTVNGAIDEYVFKAAITLPSYTEIKTYGSKLKRIPNRQLLTRSVYDASNMYAIGDYGANAVKHLIGIPLTTAGVIRPIFKLKRSFFKENRIEPSKMGANVKALLAEYFEKSELEALYTDDELMAMGFGIGDSVLDENYKPLSNIRLSGNFDDLYAPGVTFTLNYDGGEAVNKTWSQVSWYVSASGAEGTFTAIAEQTENSFKATANEAGKYIRAGIIPLSADGKTTGPKVYSEAIYIEPALDKGVDINNNAMEVVGWQDLDISAISDDAFDLGKNSRFFVLDTAEDGSDFLVIDDYWQKGNIALTKSRTVNMDPSDPNNTLAYWLNNDFLNSPNYDDANTDADGVVCTSWYGLPKSIVDNIKRDSVWRTERSTVAGVDEYVFRAAVTLPSYGEIIKYGPKLRRIGGLPYLTRTAYSSTNMFSVIDGGKTAPKHLKGSDVAAGSNGVIRAIFRLKREFFTTTRIEPDKMGVNVKALLVKNFARSELAALYTEQELTAMGFGVEPAIERLIINGTVKAGCTVTATFLTDVNAQTVEYVWSVADSKDGEFTALDADTDTYKIADSLAGKYLRVGVRIKDADGNLSGWKYFVTSNPVGEKPDMIVVADKLTYADGKINASFEFENGSGASKSMVIILAVYDDVTNELAGCDITTVNAEKGINSYNANEYAITVSANQYIKAMVWDSILNMNPYCLNVLDIK